MGWQPSIYIFPPRTNGWCTVTAKSNHFIGQGELSRKPGGVVAYAPLHTLWILVTRRVTSMRLT